MDIDHVAAMGEVGDELRQPGENLLEEDGNVLDGQAFDRHPIAIGTFGDRATGPEEVEHPVPIE